MGHKVIIAGLPGNGTEAAALCIQRAGYSFSTGGSLKPGLLNPHMHGWYNSITHLMQREANAHMTRYLPELHLAAGLKARRELPTRVPEASVCVFPGVAPVAVGVLRPDYLIWCIRGFERWQAEMISRGFPWRNMDPLDAWTRDRDVLRFLQAKMPANSVIIMNADRQIFEGADSMPERLSALLPQALAV